MLTRRHTLMQPEHDEGFTLTEVLVGATLAGIAGIIGLSLLVTVSEQATETTTTSQLAAVNRSALSQIASQLQFADTPSANTATTDGRFEVFQAGKVTFYANLYATSRVGSQSRIPPSRVSIEQVEDSPAGTPLYNKKFKLVMSVWDPTTKYGANGAAYPNPYNYTSNYPTTPSQTVVIARGITNDLSKAGEALFTYCSEASDPTPPTESPATTAATTPAPTTPAPTTSVASSSASTSTPAVATPSASDAGCNPVVSTTDATTNVALARRISSVIIRLKVASEADRTSATDYQPATWLVTRVAISGKVERGAQTTTSASVP